MPRTLPTEDRLLVEEAVRLALLAAEVAGDAVARWEAEDGEETFPAFLVRRELLGPADIRTAATAAAARLAPSPAAGESRTGPAPSEVIKGYRILDRLGRGGMGSVYRAVQTGMNRIVALKILRRPLAQDAQQVERLRREARLVGSLNHPNIVRGLDVGQSGPYHYFAMEYVDGETLRDRLQRGPMPEAEALRIIEQLVGAIDHAHSRGVVHRDVKPGNIMITPDGTPKLTDYGLAKGPSDFSLTQSGVTIGTPQYISPEQARDPTRVDVQTDLYSLGATAYHMLAGVPPHTSETLAGLLTKVLYEKPRTARQVHPRVSAGASFLVEKLMAKKKHHRYRTPQDVLRDLRRLASGRSIVPRDWSGDFEVQEVKRRFRTFAVVAAAVALALAGTVAAISISNENERLRLNEELADRDLRDLRQAFSPADEPSWEEYARALQSFTESHPKTRAAEEARALTGVATRRIAVWEKARQILFEARNHADQGRHRMALERIDRGMEDLRSAGEADARQPLESLAAARESLRQDGIEAAAERLARELKALENSAAVAGAADFAEAQLKATRAAIRTDHVDSEDVQPLARLDELLANLRRARADVEDAKFGEGFEKEVAADVLGRRFRAAGERILAVGARMEEDASLQLLLGRLPFPVAADYRGRAARRMAQVRDANAAANAEAMAKAKELAAQSRWDEALSLVSAAWDWSLDDLRAEPEALQAMLLADQRAQQAAVDARISRVKDEFLGHLARRDYWRARALLDGEEQGVEGGPPAPALREVLVAARLLLDLTDSIAFERVRKVLRNGPEALSPRGLRFDEADRIPYLQISAVKLEKTATGEVVVFDVPGMRGLRRSLHRLSLQFLLHYAGLDTPGIGADEALVRGALTVSDAVGDKSIGSNEIQAATTLLKQAEEEMPGLAPVVDALLDRARDLVRERLEEAEDREKEAQDYYTSAREALKARLPKEAQGYIATLKSSLASTRFVKSKRAEIEDMVQQTETMLKEQRLEGLFPGARSREDRATGFTSAILDFNDRTQLSALVPPEDAGPPLYDLRFDPPSTDGGDATSGRFVWVKPGGAAGADGRRRELSDSPLVLDLPFLTFRGLFVSFTYRAEDPYFLMVSIAGNNVGILNDDGRRESGRGVAAWQSEDWGSPDDAYSDLHRHDYVERARVTGEERTSEGLPYFQLEPGRTHRIQVEWDKGHMRLWVEDRLIWDKALGSKYFQSRPPRLRIVTYKPAELDDLEVRGVLDPRALDRLLSRTPGPDRRQR